MGRGEISDADLLAATRDDPAAFASFYDRYESPIVGYFLRRTRDPELAADLTAEVFAAALGAAHRYRARTPSAAAWLFTIAHHTLARSIRRRRVDARARHRLGIRESFALEPGQIEALTAVSGDEWVSDVLDRLAPDQRDAVRARIVEELPYHEIAAQMQTSELVIRKRVSRGLAALRQQMEEPS